MTNFKIDHFVFGSNTLSEGSKTIEKILNEDEIQNETEEDIFGWLHEVPLD